MPGTLALIRQRTREYLEEARGGPFQIEGRNFFPRKVVAFRRAASLNTPANRRAIWLAVQLGSLVDEVLAEVTSAEEVARCLAWRLRIGRLATTSSLAALLPTAGTRFEGGIRSVEETVMPAYRDTFEGASWLADLTSWSATRLPQRAFSYVDYSDTIFQAFVASLIAEALGLRPLASALGNHQPAFVGNGRELFFNVIPPTNILRSWRSYTFAPDNYRPDILIHDKQSGRVILADAKYRGEGGESPESGRKEVEAYMAAFGLDRVLMIYPSTPPSSLSLRYVEWEDRRLGEMALGPEEKVREWLQVNLGNLLERLMTEPRWRD
jgi:hypothetical protein